MVGLNRDPVGLALLEFVRFGYDVDNDVLVLPASVAPGEEHFYDVAVLANTLALEFATGVHLAAEEPETNINGQNDYREQCANRPYPALNIGVSSFKRASTTF